MSAHRSLRRVLSLFKRQGSENELSDEIRSHLECAEEDALRRGLSREEAQQEAHRLFGGIEQIKEAHRDSRGIPWFETLMRDLRHAFAGLRRTRSFACIVLGVLSLGMGATIAMFSLVDAVLLRPLPFPQPERIVQIWEAPRPGVFNAATPAQFLAWKQLGTRFEAMSAEQPTSAAVNASDGPLRIEGKLVTSEYFRVLGIRAALGRTFAPEEDQPGAAPVVVLSHSAWETNFGGDPDILRHPILLDGTKYQVIGVLEASALDRDEINFWKPLVFTPEDRSSVMHRLSIYGRVRADANVSQAREQMKAIYTALLSNSLMDENRGATIEVEQLSNQLTGSNLRRSIEITFGAVLVVLLITCANVANLLFARGTVRKAELAVRAALGAGRTRLVAQLLTEALALCLLGGVGGIAVAYALLRLASPFLVEAVPFTAEVQINWHVLVFALGAVVAVTLLTGTLPAFATLRGDLADTLKQATRSSSATQIRLQRAIVVAEVALSLVLAVGALLLMRSLQKLEQVDTRVHIENVVTASVHLPEQSYSTPGKAALFYQGLSERLGATPGFRRVGMATYLPLQWISNGEGIFLPGGKKQILVRCKRVNSGYFRTLDIPLMAGRGISQRDDQGAARIVVINQALAARLADVAQIKDPVGKMVRLTSADYLGQQGVMIDVQIAGILRNERTTGPGSPEPPVVYVPLAQSPSPNFRLLVRSEADEGAVVASMRRALQAVDPSLPLADIATLQQIRRQTFSGVSRPAWLIGAFAFVAIVLSAIGLYGVISYAVAQRRIELAIRMALGARSADVLGHVLLGALGMLGVGLALGLIGAYALTRTLRGFLFEISPLDPFALAAGCVVTLAIGLLAGFFPARRAARIDPAMDLRNSG